MHIASMRRENLISKIVLICVSRYIIYLALLFRVVVISMLKRHMAKKIGDDGSEKESTGTKGGRNKKSRNHEEIE